MARLVAMYAIHARYRGRERRRAQFVAQSAQALSTLEGAGDFEVIGVEDISAPISSATAVTDITMALLSAGDWAVGIGIGDAPQQAAAKALGAHARAGTVKVRSTENRELATNIASVCTMLGFILSKRTAEGREATSLMRSGFNQNEAAAELGISKQAMSQRLQAAGWQAEQAGYQLAISLLKQA